MSLDGKALRGTWGRFQRAVQLLSVIDSRTKCVLHQWLVLNDINEYKTSLEVLKDLVLTGRVVTADAAFCHQDVCQTIVDGGGYYVLPVEENRPRLLAAIESDFAAEIAAFLPLRTAATYFRAGDHNELRQWSWSPRKADFDEHDGTQPLSTIKPRMVQRSSSVSRHA
jgi:hypothetical protein